MVPMPRRAFHNEAPIDPSTVERSCSETGTNDSVDARPVRGV